MAQLTRQELITALVAALEPDPQVCAAYEGGSAAFGRVDEFSDLDFQIIVEDEAVERVARLVEAALAAHFTVDYRYEIPRPAWHGHYQVFYRFANASPLLLLDLCIIQRSSTNKFLEREIHGEAVVYFDKCGAALPPPLDPAAHQAGLAARRAQCLAYFELYSPFVIKELRRGQPVEAAAYYSGFVLGPLVDLLRMRHDPLRYNFRTRHVYQDLPAAVLARLEPLYFPASPQELEEKYTLACAWLRELVASGDR